MFYSFVLVRNHHHKVKKITDQIDQNSLKRYIDATSIELAKYAIQRLAGKLGMPELHEGHYVFQDIIFEVSHAMWKSVPQYRTGARAITSYLYTIGENAADNFVRNSTRLKRILGLTAVSGDAKGDDHACSILETCEDDSEDIIFAVSMREFLRERIFPRERWLAVAVADFGFGRYMDRPDLVTLCNQADLIPTSTRYRIRKSIMSEYCSFFDVVR